MDDKFFDKYNNILNKGRELIMIERSKKNLENDLNFLLNTDNVYDNIYSLSRKYMEDTGKYLFSMDYHHGHSNEFTINIRKHKIIVDEADHNIIRNDFSYYFKTINVSSKATNLHALELYEICYNNINAEPCCDNIKAKIKVIKIFEKHVKCDIESYYYVNNMPSCDYFDYISDTTMGGGYEYKEWELDNISKLSDTLLEALGHHYTVENVYVTIIDVPIKLFGFNIFKNNFKRDLSDNEEFVKDDFFRYVVFNITQDKDGAHIKNFVSLQIIENEIIFVVTNNKYYIRNFLKGVYYSHAVTYIGCRSTFQPTTYLDDKYKSLKDIFDDTKTIFSIFKLKWRLSYVTEFISGHLKYDWESCDDKYMNMYSHKRFIEKTINTFIKHDAFKYGCYRNDIYRNILATSKQYR